MYFTMTEALFSPVLFFKEVEGAGCCAKETSYFFVSIKLVNTTNSLTLLLLLSLGLCLGLSDSILSVADSFLAPVHFSVLLPFLNDFGQLRSYLQGF